MSSKLKVPMRILLVEDDPGHATLMSNMLRRVGAVEWVGSRTEAQRMAVAQPAFDVLVLDQHLPDGSGVEFLQWTHRNGCAARRGAVVVSTDFEAAAEAESAGATTFIAKTEGYLSRLLSAVRSL